MQSKKIALLVDNPYRDLPGLVLTAMQLCQMGHTCYLVPLNYREWEIWSLAPDFVLLNYLKKNNQEFARCAMEAGMGVGILDTEGGIFTSLDAYGVEVAPDDSVRKGIRCFCSWGPKLAHYAAEKGWFSEKQIVVTGCPRLDFYSDPWRDASLKASSYIEQYGRPQVLISGVFTLANPAFEDPEEEARGVAAFLGRPEEEVFEWQRIEQEGMRTLIDLANQLAERFPQATFIYRPHPFEKLSTYTTKFKLRSNVHVVKKGTVDGWILRSSALIQRGCSTATEASMVGVPVLSPMWMPNRGYVEDTESVSVQCQSAQELGDELEAIFAGRNKVPQSVHDNVDRITSDYYFSVDGNSHSRVAQAISAAQRPGEVSLSYCRRAIDGLTYPDASVSRHVRSAVRRMLGRSIHWSFTHWADVAGNGWDKSDKYFSLPEVQGMGKTIQELGRKHSGKSWSDVKISSAADVSPYRFGYLHGKAIALTPA